VSDVKKNTIFVGAGQVLRIVMAFILLPVASRILGDDSFGRYNIATTIMFFVMLVDDFGLNMWVTREIAKYRERAQRYFSFTIGLKAVLIAASFLFVLVVAKFSPYDVETIRAIWIFSIYAILISFRDLAIALFRAYEDMKWETVVLGLERVLITLFGIFALQMGWGLAGLSWAFVVAAVISLCLSGFVVALKFVPIGISFSIQEFWPMIKGASVFGISMFLTTMYSRIDMLMLSFMKSTEVWGWYAAAHKLIDFTNVVPNVIMIATYPAIARFSVKHKDQVSALFTRGFKLLLILAIPMVPAIFITSDLLIRIVNGPEFINAVPALQTLSFTAAILFINIYAAGLYGATNNQGKLVVIQIIGLALNTVLNYFFIPIYSHVGAAFSTVVTESLVLGITLIFAFTKITQLAEKKFLYQILIAAVLMLSSYFLMSSINEYLSLFAGLVVYFGSLFLMKTLTIRELLFFKQQQS
jgi:O-antigen/teichoic acid export membrane protein